MHGLIFIELKGSLSINVGTKLMNRFLEILENRPFTILLLSFSLNLLRLQKGMAVALAKIASLALGSLQSGVAHKLGAVHELFYLSRKETPWVFDHSSDSDDESKNNTDYLTDT